MVFDVAPLREIVAVSKAELTGSEEVRERLERELGHEVLAISSVTGKGLSQLVAAIAQGVDQNLETNYQKNETEHRS